MRRYCAVIPAYHAEATIGPLVSAVRNHGLPVVVIDDGSRDRTAALAASHGAIVLRHTRNAGKGEALRTGFTYAVQEGFHGVLTMDADGQHDPADIPPLLRAAEECPQAVIIGDRMHTPGKMPWVRWCANVIASAIVSAVSGRRIRDSQSGFRVIPHGVLTCFPLRASGYDLETELLLTTTAAGTPIRSVPVRSVYTGQVSHVRWWRDPPRFFLLIGRHLVHRLRSTPTLPGRLSERSCVSKNSGDAPNGSA